MGTCSFERALSNVLSYMYVFIRKVLNILLLLPKIIPVAQKGPVVSLIYYLKRLELLQLHTNNDLFVIRCHSNSYTTHRPKRFFARLFQTIRDLRRHWDRCNEKACCVYVEQKKRVLIKKKKQQQQRAFYLDGSDTCTWDNRMDHSDQTCPT